jgi:hypothetical protein
MLVQIVRHRERGFLDRHVPRRGEQHAGATAIVIFDNSRTRLVPIAERPVPEPLVDAEIAA